MFLSLLSIGSWEKRSQDKRWVKILVVDVYSSDRAAPKCAAKFNAAISSASLEVQICQTFKRRFVRQKSEESAIESHVVSANRKLRQDPVDGK